MRAFLHISHFTGILLICGQILYAEVDLYPQALDSAGGVSSNASIKHISAIGQSLGTIRSTNSSLIHYAGLLSAQLGKENQVILFTAIPQKTYGDAAFDPGAVANSGLTVSYVTADPAVATNADSLIYMTGAGACAVTALQPGNDWYYAATPVTNLLVVSPKPLTVSGAAADNKTYDGTTDATVSGAGLSGVIPGDTVTLDHAAAGTFAQANAGTNITVTSAMTLGGVDAHNYVLFAQPVLAADIFKADQTISGFMPTNQSVFFTTNTVVLFAAASSGLPVTFTNLPGSILSWLSPTSTTFSVHGTAQVIAQQPGDTNYNPAPAVTNDWIVHGVPVVGVITLTRETNTVFKVHGTELLANATDPEGSALTLASVSETSEQGYPVQVAGNWLIYSPPPTFTGEDTFTFTVENAFGGTGQNTATITVSVHTQDDGQTLNIVSVTPAGDDVAVHFAGIPGRVYTVQATENLVVPAWTNLGPIEIGSQGYVIFIDSNAPPSRYYRTTQP